MKAAFYYAQFFKQIKAVVLQFNPDEAAAIKESQTCFQDISVETDLKFIHNNYTKIYDVIEKIQNSALSLVESLQIVDDMTAQLQTINNEKNNGVKEKFESVLRKNPDFAKLRQICESESASTVSLSEFRSCFTYACITSVDVERSFSTYKHIYSPKQTCLTETTVETYMMKHSFYKFSSVCDTDNQSTS
ncbi:hypothetical protein K8353_40730 [Burkholderia contaminans]|nr:hypothetical protein [Burkholderia contaminans]